MGRIRTSAGVELPVEVDGPRDGSPAPVTVILAHGWTLDTRSWGPVTARLAAPGSGVAARVVRYDHRGHGRSDLPDAGHMLPLERVNGVTARLSGLIGAVAASTVPDSGPDAVVLSRGVRGSRGSRGSSGSVPAPARPAGT